MNRKLMRLIGPVALAISLTGPLGVGAAGATTTHHSKTTSAHHHQHHVKHQIKKA